MRFLLKKREGTSELRKLEFDDGGNANVNIDDLVFLLFRRISGIQLEPSISHSKKHYVDYQLSNSFGSIDGSLFYYNNSRQAILPLQKPFDLVPGLNRLELILYERENPNKKQHLHYEIEIDGRIYQSSDVIFLMEDYVKHFTNEFLDKLAESALLFECNLPGFTPKLTVKLTSDKYGKSTVAPRWVEVACGEDLDEKATEMKYIHEKSHEFYESLEADGKNEDVGKFEVFYYKNRNNNSFGIKDFRGVRDGKSIWAYDKNSVFDILCESNYLGQDNLFGHPNDGHWELFASASTIMRFFPEKSIERIQALTNQHSRDLVHQILNEVIGLYQKYCKTGTELFPQQILKYSAIT